ncbi:MFS transporter [Paenibacillus sp. RC84]|uniref:MFS transporter n=1 Tax=Paenibacillus sp. RC84 TaxID=3156252 RepID=UPI003513D474
MPTAIRTQHSFLLYLLSISAFLASLTQNIYSPVLPLLRDSFHVSLARVNASVSLFMLILAVMQLVLGPLIDSIGARKILLPGLFLTVIGSAGCSLAVRFDSFLFFRALQALGTAAVPLIAATTIGHLFSGHDRGRAMGTYQTLLSFAPAVAPVLGGFIGSRAGYAGIFWLLTGIAAVLFIVHVLYFPSSRSEGEPLPAEAKPVSTHTSYRTIFGSKIGLTVMLTGFLHFFIYFALLVYLPVLLTDHYGLGLEWVGLLYLPMAVSTLAGSWLFKKIQHRIGLTALLFWGSLLISGFIVLFALTGMASLAGLSAALVLYGISSGFTLPVHTTLLTGEFPSIRGTALGLYNFIRYAGMAAGPVVSGYLQVYVHPAPLFGLLGLAFATAVFVLLKWERTGKPVRST